MYQGFLAKLLVRHQEFLAELLVVYKGFLAKLLFMYQGFLAELLEKVSRLSRGTSQNVSRVSSWLSLAEPLNFRITPDTKLCSCETDILQSKVRTQPLRNFPL